MTTLGPKDATSASTTGWTSSWAMVHAGAGFAYVENDGTELVVTLSGFDFSALPASCTIQGIEVRCTAWKDTTHGTGTLQVGLQLSYDGGTGWTAAYKTGNLTGTAALYTLGGASGLWGRTWTRGELQASAFRARVANAFTAITDTPQWCVDHVAVLVYFEDTTPLVGGFSDRLGLVEGPSLERLVAGFSDTLAVDDGSDHVRTTAVGAAGGLLAEIQAETPSFLTASAPANAVVGLLAAIDVRGPSGTTGLYVADPVLGDIAAFVPRLLSMGDLTTSGSFGTDPQTGDATIVLPNASVGNIGGTADPVAQLVRGKYLIGSDVSILAAARADTLYTWLLFHGVVDSAEFYEDRVELLVAAIGRELIEMPSLAVDSQLMDWTDDHGKLLEESAGAVVPLCYGTFGPSALKTWPDADNSHIHPFTGGPEMGNLALLMGVRFPLAPAVAAVDGWKRNGTTGSTIAQRIFLLNDYGGAVAAGFTLAGYGAGVPRGTAADKVRYLGLGIWDDGIKRGAVYVRDYSDDVVQELKDWGSAGEVTGQLTSLNRPINRAAAFYVNLSTPAYVVDVNYYGGALMAVWLNARGVPQYETVRQSSYVPTLRDRWVDNAANAYSFDPNTWARIWANHASPGVLAVEFEAEMPARGDISSVRMVALKCTPYQSGNGPFLRLYPCTGWMDRPLSLPDIETETDVGAIGMPPWAWTVVTTHYDLAPLHVVNFYPRTLWPKPAWRFVTLDQPYNQPSAPDGQEFAWWGALQTPYPYEGALQDTYDILGLYLEVLHRPTSITGTQPPTTFSYYPLPPWRRSYGEREYYVPPNDLAAHPQKAATLATRVYACGYGPRDTVAGIYTGANGQVIENPADVAGHWIAKFANEWSLRASGTTFGSFTRARALLKAKTTSGVQYPLVPVLAQRQPLQTWLNQLAAQSMAIIARQCTDTGAAWKMFVDTDDPVADSPERLYRSTGLDCGIYFRPLDHIVAGTLRVSTTPLAEIGTDYVLDYGLHEPTGQLSYSMTVNPSGYSMPNAILGAAYQAACSNAAAAYGLQRQVTIQAPWVWHEEVAQALLCWHVDQRRYRRVFVECELRAAFLDLRVGHVVRFDDTLGAVLPYPGEVGSASWSSHLFNVVDVTVIADAGQPLRLRIMAAETYTAAG